MACSCLGLQTGCNCYNNMSNCDEQHPCTQLQSYHCKSTAQCDILMVQHGTCTPKPQNSWNLNRRHMVRLRAKLKTPRKAWVQMLLDIPCRANPVHLNSNTQPCTTTLTSILSLLQLQSEVMSQPCKPCSNRPGRRTQEMHPAHSTYSTSSATWRNECWLSNPCPNPPRMVQLVSMSKSSKATAPNPASGHVPGRQRPPES